MSNKISIGKDKFNECDEWI